ncbi:hypothetical protein GGX14DRAFT_579763 [Mycena pura]|uniref:SWIM-type domain-containing protein n=1 Tax=Mycena pura TaxID=153505 RepID=A0AAD6Y3Y7_9AGAR|nr:hypothetical protein GGX14DRAFT_579763 [Mycena pura]
MGGKEKDRMLPSNGIQQLDAGDLRTKVYINSLKVSPVTAATLKSYYARDALYSGLIDHQYDHSKNPSAQIDALAMLASLGVHHDITAPCPTGQWENSWSDNKDKVSPPREWNIRRILILCTCGYDHVARGSKTRKAAFPHTGCTAHLEITIHPSSNNSILRIRGMPEHNEGCKTAMMEHRPRQPLAPAVYKKALSQLTNGARMRAVIRTNVQLVRTRAYPGFPVNRSEDPHRWLFDQKKDTRSLLRQFRRLNGVKVTQKVEYNIDGWLDPSSPDYNPTLASAIFHYAARTAKEERFEVCVSTPEMEEAAWKYGHDGQLLLDGTFGVTDTRLLLFIVMVVDELRKGIPAAFLLFSAPSGNQQSSAGYDTEILTKLLTHWRDHLNKTRRCSRPSSVFFAPRTAITDTDMKERGALLAVFAGIWLLICRFHLKQCWRNHRNQMLKGTSQLISDLNSRLVHFEQLLLQQPDEVAARALVAREKATLEASLTDANGGSLPPIAANIAKHLNYLGDAFWLRTGLFNSWSDAGRCEAARRLNCDVSDVLSTTNHVEGFNSALKNSHIASWKRGGRRLRTDIFLHVLITDIIPTIFESRQIAAQEHAIDIAKYTSAPGGQELIERLSRSRTANIIPFVAYQPDDEARQSRGCDMVLSRQIEIPTVDQLEGVTAFEFVCHSSTSLAAEIAPTMYMVQILLNGAANCECRDFIENGWACKHICGSLALLEQLRRQRRIKMDVADIPIPATKQQAIDLQVRLGIHSRGRLAVISRATAPSLRDEIRDALAWSANGENADDDAPATGTEPLANDGPSDPAAGSDTLDASESDNDSDLLHPLTLPPLELSASESTKPSAPALASSQSAFESQAHSKLFHELPKLRHVLSCTLDAFKSSPNPAPFAEEDTEQLRELEGLWEELQTHIRPRYRTSDASAQFRRVEICGNSGTVRRAHEMEGFVDSDAPSPKRPRVVMPPSPEKRQKRKESRSAT